MLEPDTEDQTVAVRSLGATTHFLIDHPEVAMQLQNAVRIIDAAVPSLKQITVDVFVEPESGEEYLRFVVGVPDYNDGVLQQLHRANREIRQRLGQASEFIFVTTDFESRR